ncbi:unnamed protein product [Ambrosiozyma monospora]|uniref:Unnamed protein product n=1 Tax=Ambrosiozyma monospora TaxID=43982 RepID=A0A9W6Z2C1_AMBMO|nr:unnamed protein product [Ambrosiozyma monospora]
MISEPNTTTIIFKNDIPEFYDIGLDFLFFHRDIASPNNNLKGIKLISSGIHLIHLTNKVSNTRTGKFLNCFRGSLITIEFNPDVDADEDDIIRVESIFKADGSLVYADTSTDSVVDVSTQRYVEFVQENFAFMINHQSFEKNNGFWDKLWMKLLPDDDGDDDDSMIGASGAIISQINIQFLNGPKDETNDFTSLFSKTITSNDSSTLEMQKLKEAITEAKIKIQSQSQSQSQFESQSQRKQQFERDLQQPPPFNELHLTSLDTTNKKLSIRPTSDPTVMMNDYLDKSWLMAKLFKLEPFKSHNCNYKTATGTTTAKQEKAKSNFLLEFIGLNPNSNSNPNSRHRHKPRLRYNNNENYNYTNSS